MKYKIVYGEKFFEIESFVQGYIDEGWKPQGGICVTTLPDGSLKYYQAIIFNNK